MDYLRRNKVVGWLLAIPLAIVVFLIMTLITYQVLGLPVRSANIAVYLVTLLAIVAYVVLLIRRPAAR
jgi:hypothetical protein